MKIGTSRVLVSFWLFFVDFLLSREEEYLKRRRIVKYLRNLRVLILEFYPYFSDGSETRELQLYYRVTLQISYVEEFTYKQKKIYSSRWWVCLHLLTE